MANVNISPNMNMPVPAVAVDPGPDWANNLNSCLSVVDQHNHTPGQGVQITPAGLNINADLTLLSNNLTDARSVRFTPQLMPISGSADLGCLYEAGVDLYYNDGSGNQVRITQAGGVAGSPGSISNLASPASATYVSANSTFVWQSAANTPANNDGASLILRNLTANSKGLTLSPPNAMAANYTIVLPVLPSVTSLTNIDSSGNMGTWALDNSTLTQSAGVIQVPTSGITATQIAANAVTTVKILDSNVTTSKIADNAVTPAKLSASNYVLSASSGAFTTSSSTYTDVTNLSCTITASGLRPLMIMLVSDLFGGSTSRWLTNNNGSGLQAQIVKDGSTVIANTTVQITSTGAGIQSIPSTWNVFDFPTAGSHTYKVQIKDLLAGNVGLAQTCLLVYEM